MGLCATLMRIKSEDFDYLEAGEPLPGEPNEVVDVDKDWESIMFIFGNGFIGAPITGEIFMARNKILGDDEMDYGGRGYHDASEINAINSMIGDLTESQIRDFIEANDMTGVYKFHPDIIEHIVKRCLDVIRIFATAEKNGDVIITSMG